MPRRNSALDSPRVFPFSRVVIRGNLLEMDFEQALEDKQVLDALLRGCPAPGGKRAGSGGYRPADLVTPG
jgi:hypothetical protein